MSLVADDLGRVEFFNICFDFFQLCLPVENKKYELKIRQVLIIGLPMTYIYTLNPICYQQLMNDFWQFY